MLSHMHTVLAALICLMFANAASAAGVPDDFEAIYQLRVNGFVIGETQVDLTAKAAGQYLYQTRSHSTGLTRIFRSDKLLESSLFKVHEQQLRPLEYRFDHTSSNKERHAYLKFDWHKSTVTNTVEGHSWEMEIPGDALDKLIVQLAVMMDLDAGKKEFVYAVADGGKLKEYQFAITGQETVHTPAGDFATIKLERLRKDNDRSTYFWCAPALNYLPVRIKQIEHEDGLTYLSELKQTSLGAQPADQASGKITRAP